MPGVPLTGAFAVDGLCENARAGRLARAARADEDIGMGKPAGPDLTFQRLGDKLLPDDLVKGLRPPFAVERLIHAFPSSVQKIVTLDKTAHPTLNNGLCPLRRQPARIRLPLRHTESTA